MFAARSRPLFSIAGIPVRADLSLLIIGFLLATSAANRVLAGAEVSEGAALVFGAVAALAFVASILAHELGHAFAARRFGLRVEGIVLWLFGGAAGIDEARTPRQEALVAAAGPAVSAVLGGVLIGAAALGGAALPQVVAAELVLLGVINLLLAGFNLLPGLPLDGGRIARAVVWWRTGDTIRATLVAGALGGVLGLLVAAAGVWRLLEGDLFAGIWLIAIAFILRMASRAEVTSVRARRSLDGYTAAALLPAEPLRVPYLSTLEEVAATLASRPGDDVALLTEVDRVVGAIGVDQLAKARAERPWALAGSAMVGIDALDRVEADESAFDVVRSLAGDQFGMKAVVDAEGRVVGVLSVAAAMRWLQRRTQLGPATGRS